jgi:type II secretory pathway pseudopilin PulG
MHQNATKPAGFTIAELIVAVGIVVLLMVGVTQIFKFAGDTVSAGQALSTGTRDGRAAQAVFSRDLAAIAKDGPAIVIRSRVRAAFRNPAERRGDIDLASASNAAQVLAATLTRDIDGNGIEGETTIAGEVSRWFDTNDRVHRLDTFSFFARDNFPRQTANSGAFLADQSSLEAWIHYGHVALPDNSLAFTYDPATKTHTTDPGVGSPASNPNNHFANQWVLGRVAMLLLETGTTGQNLYARPNGSTNLEPLSDDTLSTGTPSFSIRSSRYDLARTGIDDYRDILQRALALDPARPWWNELMGAARFQVNPFFARGTGIDLSESAAQMAPLFMQGCSQFIVEFAGDFLAQDPATGAITGNFLTGTTDGQIDFVIVGTGANVRRQILWYGFPRDTTGLDGLPDGAIIRSSGDVVPLAHWIGAAVPFERVQPLPAIPAPNSDYYAVTPPAGQDTTYVAAWGPRDGERPRMIRMVMRLEDPESRLQEPQTFEYVFSLP